MTPIETPGAGADGRGEIQEIQIAVEAQYAYEADTWALVRPWQEGRVVVADQVSRDDCAHGIPIPAPRAPNPFC